MVTVISDILFSFCFGNENILTSIKRIIHDFLLKIYFIFVVMFTLHSSQFGVI